MPSLLVMVLMVLLLVEGELAGALSTRAATSATLNLRASEPAEFLDGDRKPCFTLTLVVTKNVAATPAARRRLHEI